MNHKGKYPKHFFFCAMLHTCMQRSACNKIAKCIHALKIGKDGKDLEKQKYALFIAELF